MMPTSTKKKACARCRKHKVECGDGEKGVLGLRAEQASVRPVVFRG
jgi:hypothetical protein